VSKCPNDKERKEVCSHNCTTFSNRILRERLISEKKKKKRWQRGGRERQLGDGIRRVSIQVVLFSGKK